MKDLSLLNELELKIREMVSALEREKSRNVERKNSIQESSKLSEIEEKVKNLYKDSIVDETDGIKFIWNDKWLHIRKSNTEPIMRIYAEAPDKIKAEELVKEVKSLI